MEKHKNKNSVSIKAPKRHKKGKTNINSFLLLMFKEMQTRQI